jgi:hypothetical protein
MGIRQRSTPRPLDRIGQSTAAVVLVVRFVRIVAVSARVSGGLLVLAAGALHLWLYFDFFHRVHVIGVLFLLNAVTATMIGFVLLLSSRRVAAAAGIVYSLATLGGFFFSVYHGLFGYVERLNGPWQDAVGGVELAAIVVLLPLLVTGPSGLSEKSWWQTERELTP